MRLWHFKESLSTFQISSFREWMLSCGHTIHFTPNQCLQAQLSVSGSTLCADFDYGNKVAENINLSNFQIWIFLLSQRFTLNDLNNNLMMILLPCYWPSNYQLPGRIDGFTYFYQLQQRLGIIIFALWSVIGKDWHDFPVFILVFEI